MVEACVYCGYWACVVLAAFVKYKRGTLFDADAKWKKEQAKKREEEERMRREAELLALTPPSEAMAITAGGGAAGSDDATEGVPAAAGDVKLVVDPATAVSASSQKQ